MIKIINLWGPVLLWCALIFFLSSKQNLRVVSDTFGDFILRKLAHLIEYLGLYLLIYRATKRIWWSLVLCMIYALSDEGHQRLVPTRAGNPRDVLIDFGGSFLGLFLVKEGRKK